jgi:hypothetical protein
MACLVPPVAMASLDPLVVMACLVRRVLLDLRVRVVKLACLVWLAPQVQLAL